jgi:2',3'-cyclic-nucleotide 2'-phosphodiesterase (5'-nucleotidase family)
LTGGDRGQGVPIAQAGWNAEHLGRITLEVDDDGVRVVDLTLEAVPESAPADPAVLAELAACEDDLDAWLDEPVAWLPEPVPHSRTADSAVARLTAEALLADRPGEIGVLIAAHCQTGLPSGTVRRRAVWAATSSPGNTANATLTGAQVRAMLRRGLSQEFARTISRTFRGLPYGRLQVVGAYVDGDRVLVGDEPLDDARTYAVTGSDLELSSYGTLVDQTPDDLVVHAPAILPEILEAYLRNRFPLPDHG